jgi:DNA-binding transcriptional ArsR family regulator
MAKEKFILVSLKEQESKQLAQVLANDTSRKILDSLAENEATESELSEKLKIPISTVHYNLQALVNGKLVEADEFHYSQKGKEVLHYKLANKYIIIAPKSTFGIREKLRGILPVGIIALAGSFLVYFFDRFKPTSIGAMDAMQDSAFAVAQNKMMETAAVESPRLMAGAGNIATSQPFWQTFLQNPALWFLFGCIFTLLLIIVVEYIHYKKKER